MQISKVNSTNFKGLWEVRKTTLRGVIDHDMLKPAALYKRELVYHPFKDEDKESAKHAVENIKREPVGTLCDFNTSTSMMDLSYIVNKATLGEKLDITQEEYDKIHKMNRSAYPKYDNCLYETTDERLPEVQQLLDEE